jgi:hypothetical protein
VPEVSKFFKSSGDEAGYTVVLHILLPMVAELTTDRNAQVWLLVVFVVHLIALVLY